MEMLSKKLMKSLTLSPKLLAVTPNNIQTTIRPTDIKETVSKMKETTIRSLQKHRESMN